jgi:hypothetical protein
MVDTSRAIIQEDGSSDAHVRLVCHRCDNVTYVYAEHYEMSSMEKHMRSLEPNIRHVNPVTIRDLPSFCRHCGKEFEVWTLEYSRAWEPTYRKEETDVVSEI